MSQDVVDLLPGPIWHIIFRHLLLPTDYPAPLLNLREFSNCFDREELFDLSDPTQAEEAIRLFFFRMYPDRETHEENTRRYGSSWPLLRCAMVSKRLLHHVISFSELEPISLLVSTEERWWRRALFWFLKQRGHQSLDLGFSSLTDLESLNRRLASSAHSLTSLCLVLKTSYQYRSEQYSLINPTFLRKFGQLQRLELGRGRWQLHKLSPAWFKALRSLTIDHVDCNDDQISFLSSISLQLHEFSFSSSNHGSRILSFEFPVARTITICVDRQALNLRFSLHPSLKAFSVMAAELELDCECDSPISLDSLTLVCRRQLVVSSLPLASAKNVYMRGPITKEELGLSWAARPGSAPQPSLAATQLPFTQLLTSIAPTVETLLVRHGWPLEDVPAEWSRLRCLGIGANDRRQEDVSSYSLWGSFGEGGSNGSRIKDEATTPPFIDAPMLQSIFFATRRWRLRALASLLQQFPSLTFYCILGRSFRWEK